MPLLWLPATLVVALASLTACLSTPRARPRLPARAGWLLGSGLLALAIALLAGGMGLAEAAAFAVSGLMVGVPAVSALLGWRHRQGQRDAG